MSLALDAVNQLNAAKTYKRKSQTWKRKRSIFDMDQIIDGSGLKETPVASKEDLVADQVDGLPGRGQHYCQHCSRFFINEPALTGHLKSKSHKQKVKEIDEELNFKAKRSV